MTDKQHKLVTLATVVIVGWLLFAPPSRERTRHRSASGNAAPVAVKARALRSFYSQMAEVVERDGGDIVKTLGQFRAAHTRALRLAFRGTAIAEGAPAGEQIDRILADAIGGDLQDRPLTDALRADLVAGLRRVADHYGGPTDGQAKSKSGGD